MLKLDGISSFVAIAEVGSISAAGRRLNLSKSVVSERLAELEHGLGAPLFHRTTRKLSLTEDGAAFLERAVRIVRHDFTRKCKTNERGSGRHGLPAIDAHERRGRDAISRLLERFAYRGVHQRFAGLEMTRRLIEADTVPRLFLDQQERAVANDNRRDGHGRPGQLVFTHGVGLCIVSVRTAKRQGRNPALLFGSG